MAAQQIQKRWVQLRTEFRNLRKGLGFGGSADEDPMISVLEDALAEIRRLEQQELELRIEKTYQHQMKDILRNRKAGRYWGRTGYELEPELWISSPCCSTSNCSGTSSSSCSGTSSSSCSSASSTTSTTNNTSTESSE